MKNRFTTVISFFLAVVMTFCIIPSTAFTALAASWDIHYGDSVYAGQTAVFTCQGGAAWQITNVIFESNESTIAHIVGYDPDGEVFYENDYFFDYIYYSEILLYGGTKYVIDVYYGSIQLKYNLANTLPPIIECSENGQSLDPLVALNESPLYTQPGETQTLAIDWVRSGFSVSSLRFSSDNNKVATVDDDGLLTALAEGETVISVYFTIVRNSDQAAAGTKIECPVYVVDDNVDKKSGLRFYYSKDTIEPGDIFQVGADYAYGDFTGTYYPGRVEWQVSNENVLKIDYTLDNITIVKFEALALGECEISLLLDGVVKCTETINVSLSDDTLIRDYRDYLMNCSVMTTLDEARNTCWKIIDRFSGFDKTRIAFFSCLKSDLGLSVITKEAAALFGLTSSTKDDMVDEALDLLMAELFSAEKAEYKDGLSTFKKRFKNYGAFKKVASAAVGTSTASALSQITSFTEEQIKGVEDVANDFIGDGISMAELVAAAVMTVQYERDTVVYLMNIVASTPAGSSSELYKGLNRLLWEMDNLSVYVARKFLNDKAIDSLKEIIKMGLFYKDAKIFDKTIWGIASSLGKLIASAYEKDGNVLSDDYMKAMLTSGFAGTLYQAVKNSNSASTLEGSFNFYVVSVKTALNASIDLCGDVMVNCRDLEYIAEDYLEKIDSFCTYENLLKQCNQAVYNATELKGNVYLKDDEIVVAVYRELPNNSSRRNAPRTSSQSTSDGSVISIPSHINGQAVTALADGGFQNGADISSVILPNSVKYIGNSALADCSMLSTVVIGGYLLEIGDYAFNNDSSLQVIDLPESLHLIGEGAFNNCSQLQSIDINASQVKSKAFFGCSSLSRVTFTNKNAEICNDAFENCSEELTIYGYHNSTAETFATEQGYSFVDLAEIVSSIEINTPATKTEFLRNEEISTDGLSINVTYFDGSAETLNDGWIAYADTSIVGDTLIKIYYGDNSITYPIHILETEPESISINSSNLNILIGETRQLSAVIQPDSLSDLRLEWSSNNEDIVHVEKNGLVLAVSEGTAMITVRIVATDISATVPITVTDTTRIEPSVQSAKYMMFTPNSNGLYVFYSSVSRERIEGTILDVNGNVLEKQSGSSFRIERKLHAGQVYVFKVTSYTNNDAFDCTIKKCVPAENIHIKDKRGDDITEIIGYSGYNKPLHCDFSPVNYASENYTWASEDESVASIDDNGNLRLVNAGTTVISALSKNGLSDSCTVTVKPYTDCETINTGDTKTVSFIDKDNDSTYMKFVPEENGWYGLYSESIDENDSDHFATLLTEDGDYICGGIDYDKDLVSLEHEFTAGNTYIFQIGYAFASFDDCTLKHFNVHLKKLDYATEIQICEGESFEGYPYETIELSAEFNPNKEIIPESYTWSSSNETVATVNSYGDVSLLKPGTATITVTSDSGRSDSCVVTVKEFPQITLNETKRVEIAQEQGYQYFSFTPEQNGWYAFYSESDLDTYCYLYSDGSRLAYDGSGGEGNNFRIEYEMLAEKQYVFKAKMNRSNETGSFDVKLIKMIPAESISILPGNSTNGYPGETRRLSVVFGPDNAIKESFTWQSADTSIATVDEYGVVSLISIGETVITVTSENGLTNSCTVHVVDYPEIHSGDIVTVTIDETRKNAYFKFTPEVSDTYVFTSISNSDTYGYLLDTDGTTITSNDDGGSGRNFMISYALDAGKTYIYRCKFYSSSATGNFDVELYHICDAESLAFEEGSTLSGQEGSILTLTPKFLPNHARTESVSWSSSDETLATVENGSVTLLNEGTVTITATSERGLVSSCEIIINGYERIAVGEQKTVVISTAGEKAFLKFVPETDGYYSFYSSGSNDTYGYIYDADMNQLAYNDDGAEGGNFKVSYRMTADTTYFLVSKYYSSSDTGSFDVSITRAPNATAISIQSECHGYVGEYQYLYVHYEPNDAAQEEITWASSNEDVATVSSSGRIDFVADGEAVITAKTESGLVASCTVTVSTRPVATAISISEQLIGYVGDYTYLSVSFTPEDCIQEDITWTSSNENVVTVSSSGKATYVSVGTATITAQSKNGLTAVCAVTVIEPPTIYVDVPFGVTIQNNERQTTFFTPEESGNYCFICNNYSNSNRASISVYSANGRYIASNSRKLFVNLEGGVKYKITTNYESYSGNGSGTYDLLVSKAVPATSLIPLDEVEKEVYVNSLSAVSVKVDPWNAESEDIVWASADESIISIEDTYQGVSDDIYNICSFNAVSIGTTTITATTENGLTTQFTINVKDYDTISIGEQKSATINSEGEHAYFKFVPAEDGYYAFYSTADSDTYGYIRDAEMNQLASDDDSGDGSNFKVRYQMTAGTTYILDARYYSSSATGSFDVTIEQTKYITKLEITSLPNQLEYVKGFVSSYLQYEGIEIKATWSDGSTSIWDYSDNYIEDERVRINTSTVEDDGVITISCGGQEVQFQVNIIENPVSSLEISQGTAKIYIENYNGYETTWHNDETDQDEDMYYYYTDYPDDAVIKVNYKDGTYKTAHIGDNLDGYQVTWKSNQNDTPWSLGTNNISIVSYLGVTVNLPITVRENPVDHIEVVQSPAREYIFGDFEYGYSYEDGEYYFRASDLTGLVLRIFYTDGSTKDVLSDIMANNSYADTSIDGFELYLDSYISADQPGEYPVTISYLDKEASYNVKLINSPVDHIEISELPDLKSHFELCSPNWIGLSFNIYYKDGTKKEVVVDSTSITNKSTYNFGLCFGIDVDGHFAYLVRDDYESDNYSLCYMDQTCKIEGLTSTSKDAISHTQMQVDSDEQMVPLGLIVYFESGITEYYQFKSLISYETEASYVRFYAITDEGIISCYSFVSEEDGQRHFIVFGEEAECTFLEPLGQVCEYCGKVHSGPLGNIIRFFHKLILMFKRMFGAQAPSATE